MENWEQLTLINELAQGMDLAKQLRLHVGPSSTTQTREYLVQKILSSYDKALMILNWSESLGKPRQNVATTSLLLPESPPGSLEGSPHSEASDKVFKDQDRVNDASKKRKTQQPKWTNHVRIYSESGLEGPHDDGHSWRKYGQKDILGAIYPRSYYRCTYRNIKHCWATKQVQRSDEDPTVFEITYKGKHTCLPEPDCEPKAVQDKKLQKQNAKELILQNQADDNLQNLKGNLRVNTEDLTSKEMMVSHLPLTSGSAGCMMNGNYSGANFDGSLMQMFASPAASASNNYFPVSPIHQNSSFGGGFGTICCSESDRSDMFSSNASTTNSPYLDLDFTLDPTNADRTFSPGFFP